MYTNSEYVDPIAFEICMRNCFFTGYVHFFLHNYHFPANFLYFRASVLSTAIVYGKEIKKLYVG